MPTISNQKKEKISEQILHYLFTVSPEAQFTNKIATEVARDEEFTKVLLQDLENKKLVVKISKSSTGTDYNRRLRWRLTNNVYEMYKKHQ